jgi:glycosyltransferase involved in cell wall biosynthesis
VTGTAASFRILCLLPAHNEAANLAAVILELRACRPDLDLLVVDDGSTDGTAALMERLDVRWLRLPERMGIGGAIRAGLRYAARLGYDIVVRMDGDGQHRPEDVERLLAPIVNDGADVVLGSRYVAGPDLRVGIGTYTGAWRPAERLLAACLWALTGKRVTDPTSGFYGLGPRAVRVLAEHHPTGYPEPELRLFLSRNALKTIEVPVRGRPRPAGKTSLTPVRVTAAGARVMLAMVIVPLRGRVGLAGD